MVTTYTAYLDWQCCFLQKNRDEFDNEGCCYRCLAMHR